MHGTNLPVTKKLFLSILIRFKNKNTEYVLIV